MATDPFEHTTSFTFEDLAGTTSLEPTLKTLLHGDINNPAWKTVMRGLLTRCSNGPFDVSNGDPLFDSEPTVVLTNPAREVLAKCGPVADSRSCFDAIFFAAAANALRRFLEE